MLSLTQELLYLLLLYAVLADGKISQTTALLIAFAIILVGPCISKLCCPNAFTPTPCSGGFSNLNNLV